VRRIGGRTEFDKHIAEYDNNDDNNQHTVGDTGSE
jgi:hypothetical protein